MRRITTDSAAKENTQGRHYTRKSALERTQVADPLIMPPRKNSKSIANCASQASRMLKKASVSSD
jgi:hypothetical protein